MNHLGSQNLSQVADVELSRGCDSRSDDLRTISVLQRLRGIVRPVHSIPSDCNYSDQSTEGHALKLVVVRLVGEHHAEFDVSSS